MVFTKVERRSLGYEVTMAITKQGKINELIDAGPADGETFEEVYDRIGGIVGGRAREETRGRARLTFPSAFGGRSCSGGRSPCFFTRRRGARSQRAAPDEGDDVLRSDSRRRALARRLRVSRTAEPYAFPRRRPLRGTDLRLVPSRRRPNASSDGPHVVRRDTRPVALRASAWSPNLPSCRGSYACQCPIPRLVELVRPRVATRPVRRPLATRDCPFGGLDKL